MKLLSTKEVAEILGISTVRVFQLIKEGKLPAQKVGRDWLVEEKDAETAKARPGRGRPLKTQK